MYLEVVEDRPLMTICESVFGQFCKPPLPRVGQRLIGGSGFG
jgi:hypothetical protein